jgi:hypothetical protein
MPIVFHGDTVWMWPDPRISDWHGWPPPDHSRRTRRRHVRAVVREDNRRRRAAERIRKHGWPKGWVEVTPIVEDEEHDPRLVCLACTYPWTDHGQDGCDEEPPDR